MTSKRELELPCCDGVAWHGSLNGGDGCTCWEPIYDREQAELISGLEAQARATPCDTCACRSLAETLPDGSPVPWDLENAYGDMLNNARRGRPFYCHKGMRKLIGYRHPQLGQTHVDDPDACAEPPFVDGVPYDADGRPSPLCAAWVGEARRLVRAS